MQVMLKATTLAIALLTHLAPCACAADIEQPRERVFLVRDKAAAGLHFHMMVFAGCSDEADNQCRGLAHYVEHLVLVGRNPEHAQSAVKMFPEGSANGWTNMRVTGYVHSIPAKPAGVKADLEHLFKFYAARLKGFDIAPDEALRERNIVLQEHDWRVGGNHFAILARDMERRLLPDNPYGQWTIGTRSEIAKFTLEDARAFHGRWYALNNAVFIVRGDIEPAELKEIADKALAGLEARPLPPYPVFDNTKLEPGRDDMKLTNPRIKRSGVIVKKLVRMDDADFIRRRAARSILANFLTSQLPGSLYDALVEREELAAGPPSYSLNRVAPGIFALTIAADVAPVATPERLLHAMTAYIDNIGNIDLTDVLIDRLKTRFSNGRANADKDAALVHKRLIDWFDQRNTFAAYNAWPGEIASITGDDVRAAAKDLSGPGRIVTGVAGPAAAEGAQKP
jgi:zinc protease